VPRSQPRREEVSTREIRATHSIAIWYETTQASGEKNAGPASTLQLHVNLWRLRAGPRRTREVTFLDLGLLITPKDDIARLKIFLPFRVSVDDLVDLGEQLRKPQILVAIFNDDLQIHGAHDRRFAVDTRAGKRLFSSRILEIGSDFRINAEEYESAGIRLNGTILEIERRVFEPADGYSSGYIRFRIILSGQNAEAFCTEYRPKDRPLLTAFDRTEIVDFRLNERRNLPLRLTESLGQRPSCLFNISEINYFLAREVHEELELAHRDFHKCRSLEGQIWNDYARAGLGQLEMDQTIIYYWRTKYEEDKFEDFNALTKFRRREVSGKTILLFIFSAILIGAIGSLTASFIWEHFGFLLHWTFLKLECLEGWIRAAWMTRS
jgi:hypothetical protein